MKSDLYKLEAFLINRGIDAVYFQEDKEDDEKEMIFIYDAAEMEIFKITGGNDCFLINSFITEYETFFNSRVKLNKFLQNNPEGK